MFTGPQIIKGDGALGARAASDDNILGLVISAPLPTLGGGGGSDSTADDDYYTTYGTSVKLIQASDADALGLDASYDANKSVLVRYHIDEFFRLNPQGTLWLMLVAQTVTLAQMCDKVNAYVQKLVSDSDKKVKTIGVVRNPANGYTPTITDGIDVDVTNAVVKAQALVDAWRVNNIFVDMIVIEGRSMSLTASQWINLRSLLCANIHVCALQDNDIANLDAAFAGHAAVGTVLGGIGVRRVEEDLGSVNAENNPDSGAANFPINNAADGLWINPGISSGKLMKDMTAPEVALLKTNGFVFADSYPEYPGVYFSGSPACTDLSSDYAYGVNTRVWNKGARKAVFKLTPKFNSKVQLIGGKIKATTIFSWESDVNNSNDGLGSLVSDGYCTKAKTSIDPNQDVFGTSKVVVKMSITPYGYSRVIEGELGFSI